MLIQLWNCLNRFILPFDLFFRAPAVGCCGLSRLNNCALILTFLIRCLRTARFVWPSLLISWVRIRSDLVNMRYAWVAAGRAPKAATFEIRMINAMATFDKFIFDEFLFSGSLYYYPNIEAIHWFVDNVCPLLSKKIDYELIEPRKRKTVKKSYADNFLK